MPYPIQILLTALFLSLALNAPALAADNEMHPVAQTVLYFNAALSTRDMDTALALLADGSVQYNLRPVHPGMSEDVPLTEDMTNMWTTVSAVLFSTTKSYERHIDIRDVHVDGELGVVWTQTKTMTHRNNDQKTSHEFSEMYFLINKDNSGWRIAGTATNRPVDDVPIN